MMRRWRRLCIPHRVDDSRCWCRPVRITFTLPQSNGERLQSTVTIHQYGSDGQPPEDLLHQAFRDAMEDDYASQA